MPRSKKSAVPVRIENPREDLPKPPKRPKLHVIKDYLSVLFLVMWIVIGAFILLLIFSEIKQGALASMFASPSSVQQGAPTDNSAPTETDLPGVGMVNISCVQSTLSSTELQKIVQTGDASNLTADEKAKLAPCVTQAESATPSASPSK